MTKPEIKVKFKKPEDPSLQFQDPVEISLKDFGIQETPYLLNSIRNNKDAIVLKIDISLDRVLDPESEKDKLLSRHLKRIYQLPTYPLAKNSEYHEDDIERLFFEAGARSWDCCEMRQSLITTIKYRLQRFRIDGEIL